MPALVNAIHNDADMLLVILDNSGTAMTGFQPHPGTPVSAAGERLPALDIPRICEAFGAEVTIGNPFDFEETRRTLQDLLEGDGPRVLILRQPCALSPERRAVQGYRTVVHQERCIGEDCGCNRLCTRLFKCPGLNWNPDTRTTEVDEVICTSCGVCVAVCPHDAIEIVEVVS
jgi:indolepyruvate ferredoxin oxidoreductase alpha subunit